MNPLFAFTLLSLVLYLKNAHCQLPESNCKNFADLLPRRLRDLRIKFNEIKDYFVSMKTPFSQCFFCPQGLEGVKEEKAMMLFVQKFKSQLLA